ncbi:MAG: MBL fold metallo-hydrolase, partial [Promethearchaeota archaeon]
RLVNTHHNGDHTWGNQLFKGSEIIAHRLCAEELKKDKIRDLPDVFDGMKKYPEYLSSGLKHFAEHLSEFEYSDIEIKLPNHLIDDKLELDLEGYPCHLIYVGPAHSPGDLIVYLPEDDVIFAGDIVFTDCHPICWEGTHSKWIEALDLILSFNPEIIVPGHGPLCDVDKVKDLRDYFEYIYSEAKKFFDDDLDPLEASKKIDIGPYLKYSGPERLYFFVHRAYREFKNVELWNARLNSTELFNKSYELWLYWNENGII